MDQLALLNEQGLVLEVLSVMQHHDAMTGTHMKAVGNDYLHMIDQTEEWSLDSERSGILAKELVSIAKSHGIEIKDKLVGCPVEGQHTLDCLDSLEKGEHLLLSLYNPNLQPIKGLFLLAKRMVLNL